MQTIHHLSQQECNWLILLDIIVTTEGIFAPVTSIMDQDITTDEYTGLAGNTEDMVADKNASSIAGVAEPFDASNAVTDQSIRLASFPTLIVF